MLSSVSLKVYISFLGSYGKENMAHHIQRIYPYRRIHVENLDISITVNLKNEDDGFQCYCKWEEEDKSYHDVERKRAIF